MSDIQNSLLKTHKGKQPKNSNKKSEEAEHAAKFAELLGSDLESNVTDSTKKNFVWRVNCEFGAANDKFELAACAKKNGLDAIHDTVHEMARDEARHGRALKGLLERYFK